MRSNTALTIERREKMMEAMGMDGRHATLSRLSVTQLDERGSFQGSVRMPRIIRNNNKTEEIALDEKKMIFKFLIYHT